MATGWRLHSVDWIWLTESNSIQGGTMKRLTLYLTVIVMALFAAVSTFSVSGSVPGQAAVETTLTINTEMALFSAIAYPGQQVAITSTAEMTYSRDLDIKNWTIASLAGSYASNLGKVKIDAIEAQRYSLDQPRPHQLYDSVIADNLISRTMRYRG